MDSMRNDHSRQSTLRSWCYFGLLAFTFLGTACSGSPSAPGVITAGRRVLGGSGGGEECVIPFCPLETTGRIEIATPSGTLSGQTRVLQSVGLPMRFSLEAGLTGTGRIEQAGFSAFVNSTTASVSIGFQQGDVAVGGAETQIAASVAQLSDSSCANGLIETTIVDEFENVGRATIVERHCAQ